MISRGIVKSLASGDDWLHFTNRFSHSGYYLEGTNIFVLLRGVNRAELVIGDVSNAYKRGKMCVFYRLTGKDSNSIYQALAKVDFDVKAMLSICASVDSETERHHKISEDVNLSKYSEKGVNTFSPFLLDRLKPMKEIPKKWMTSHVIRMLANDQFENLSTIAIYTDDYAYDTASNYQQGAVARDDMLLRLVERPSGWWYDGCEKDGDELAISCGSFDCKKCIVRLDGVKAVTDAEAEVEPQGPTVDLTSPPPAQILKPAGILLQ